MIDREILDLLVPKPPEDSSVPTYVPGFVREDPILLKLAIWESLAWRAWFDTIPGGFELDFEPFPQRYRTIGFGIVAVGERAEPLDAFPVVKGYQFGVVVYLPMGTDTDGRFDRRYLRENRGGHRIPLHIQKVDIITHCHPSNGRSAAIVSKNGGDYVLTAGHNVSHLSHGSPVSLQSPNSSFTAPLDQKALGCVDAALIGPLPVSGAAAATALGSSATAYATPGQTVDLCLGSATPGVQATIMQSFHQWQRFINIVQANTFLIDRHGVPGDSGAAVAAITGDAVGMYLGQTNVEDRSGTMHQMGYAIDVQQCLDVFEVSLQGAIL